MFAVIFRAKIAQLDDDYQATAEKIRRLAINQYGCLEFTSCREGDYEIAISYWESESQIVEWRTNSEHLIAQGKGRQKWYESYSVQVTEIKREYKSIKSK